MRGRSVRAFQVRILRFKSAWCVVSPRVAFECPQDMISIGVAKFVIVGVVNLVHGMCDLCRAPVYSFGSVLPSSFGLCRCMAGRFSVAYRLG